MSVMTALIKALRRSSGPYCRDTPRTSRHPVREAGLRAGRRTTAPWLDLLCAQRCADRQVAPVSACPGGARPRAKLALAGDVHELCQRVRPLRHAIMDPRNPCRRGRGLCQDRMAPAQFQACALVRAGSGGANPDLFLLSFIRLGGLAIVGLHGYLVFLCRLSSVG